MEEKLIMKIIKTHQYLVFFVLLLTLQPSNAAIVEGGRGLLFGGDHAFSVKAKSGWVLDNESGIDLGLRMVFYPKDSNWTNSKVIVYGRSISTSAVPTIKGQVKATVNEFISNGSIKIKITSVSDAPLNNGDKAKIYLYTGDKFGNYEAVAYIKEYDSINFMVFNAREKDVFDNYLDDFYQIVATYKNEYTSSNNYDLKKLKSFTKASKLIVKTESGKKYEVRAMKAVGNKMSQTLKTCESYMRNKTIPSFTYLVQINKNGTMKDSLISPANTIANCFSGLMSDSHYPVHNLDNMVLEYVFKFKD